MDNDQLQNIDNNELLLDCQKKISIYYYKYKYFNKYWSNLFDRIKILLENTDKNDKYELYKRILLGLSKLLITYTDTVPVKKHNDEIIDDTINIEIVFDEINKASNYINKMEQLLLCLNYFNLSNDEYKNKKIYKSIIKLI